MYIQYRCCWCPNDAGRFRYVVLIIDFVLSYSCNICKRSQLWFYKRFNTLLLFFCLLNINVIQYIKPIYYSFIVFKCNTYQEYSDLFLEEYSDGLILHLIVWLMKPIRSQYQALMRTWWLASVLVSGHSCAFSRQPLSARHCTRLTQYRPYADRYADVVVGRTFRIEHRLYSKTITKPVLWNRPLCRSSSSHDATENEGGGSVSPNQDSSRQHMSLDLLLWVQPTFYYHLIRSLIPLDNYWWLSTPAEDMWNSDQVRFVIWKATLMWHI